MPGLATTHPELAVNVGGTRAGLAETDAVDSFEFASIRPLYSLSSSKKRKAFFGFAAIVAAAAAGSANVTERLVAKEDHLRMAALASPGRSKTIN